MLFASIRILSIAPFPCQRGDSTFFHSRYSVKDLSGRSFFTGVAVLLFLFINLPQLVAQPPRLNFRRIDVTAFPKITGYFSVKCNGQFQNNVTAKNITVEENGEQMNIMTLTCPSDVLCCQSVALILDRSGSMNGAPMEQLKEAAKLYASLLDTTCDQASVVSFASNTTVDVFMTSDTSLLNPGIDNIVSSGATALWDGVGTGVAEVVKNGSKDCRVVIVATDGGENASVYYTLDDCIALAQGSSIRVFTIGLGNGVVEPPLQQLARETGGIYYHAPSGDQLKAIFKEIYKVISQRFQECSFTYMSSCPDGAVHMVKVTVGSPSSISGCIGTDTRTRVYRAILDTTRFTFVNISLDNIPAPGPGAVTIPLRVEDSVKAPLTPATFRVLFDSTCLTWSDFSTQGGQWDGVPAVVTPVPGGVEVRMLQRKIVPGKGILGTMTFQTVDTTITCKTCEVRLENWDLESGCITPVLSNGTVVIGEPAIDLQDPPAGIGICSGKDYVVRWKESCVDSVTILLSDNGGSSWKILAEHLPAGNGEWTWTVSEQAGTRYRLRIFDSFDNTLVDETQGDFFILSPPHVEKHPADQIACLGAGISFESKASGQPAPGIQWQVSTDGGATFTDIPNQTTLMLSLTNVVDSMEGYLYRARFSNTCGDTYSDAASLGVINVPQVNVSPYSVTICKGGQAVFIGARKGERLTFVQWQKSVVGSAVFTNIPGAIKDTLVVQAADVSQTGTRYRLAVGNKCDTVYSSPASLVVRDIPGISGQPQSVDACPGDSVSLSVQAINASSYQWQKDGVEIPGATSSTLAIGPVTHRDGGTYQVLLKNECGISKSQPAQLNVVTNPVIVRGPVSKSANEGEIVTLSVDATGGGLTYQWWKDGAALPGAKDSALTFLPVRKSDEGTYVVVVRNACGEVRSDTVYLSVTVTSVRGTPEAANGVVLFQNYPNPLGAAPPEGDRQTAIAFTLPGSGHVLLRVFTIRGEEIAVLVNDVLASGSHTVRLDARNLRPGVYYYRLEFTPVGGRRIPVVQTKKLVIMK